MKLYIKNMVCGRCERVVREELEKAGFTVIDIKLGEAEINQVDQNELAKIREILLESGFELIEDKNIQLIERIKTLVIDLIHHNKSVINQNYSDIISKKLGKDYHFLSTLFSSKENITIEKYIILQKIEKVKEYLVYNELSLSEIAYQMNYSSVAHLSSQFKQVTGMTPSEFKKSRGGRKPLDLVK